ARERRKRSVTRLRIVSAPCNHRVRPRMAFIRSSAFSILSFEHRVRENSQGEIFGLERATAHNGELNCCTYIPNREDCLRASEPDHGPFLKKIPNQRGSFIVRHPTPGNW